MPNLVYLPAHTFCSDPGKLRGTLLVQLANKTSIQVHREGAGEAKWTFHLVWPCWRHVRWILADWYPLLHGWLRRTVRVALAVHRKTSTSHLAMFLTGPNVSRSTALLPFQSLYTDFYSSRTHQRRQQHLIYHSKKDSLQTPEFLQ